METKYYAILIYKRIQLYMSDNQVQKASGIF